MSQTPESTPPRATLPADLPWGIHYLREDIQDLRQELRHEVSGLRGELKELRSEVSAQINGLRNNVDTQINGLRNNVDTQITGLRGELKELRGEMKELRGELYAKLDTHFKWTIGTLVTLTGVVVAVFKL